MIRSNSNPRLKAALRLRDSRARRTTGRFLIDGQMELERAVESGIAVETVFFSGSAARESVDALDIPAGALWEVTPELLKRLNYGEREGGVVCVALTPDLALSQLRMDAKSLVLALEKTEKPGNLGACLRSAAACAVDAVLLVDPICELYNPNTIRASRGSVFGLPIAVVSRGELLEAKDAHGLCLMSARVDGRSDLWDCDFRSGCILLFGNEALGLDDTWSRCTDIDFTIPMPGSPDSLNLSISTAVTLYEAIRQRSVPNI